MEELGHARTMRHSETRGSVRERGAACQVPRALVTTSANPAMARLLMLAREVAATDTTVLLTGETGTGKEVIARHIHALSRRARHPFVAVNCGAFPAQLIESELFGHERGAFSGALERRIGHFEAAQGGTLLLDEVSEIPLNLQTRLLRVLQEREVQRIGSSRPVPLDVRIIATSNRDLRAMVERGELRKDLLYRINVFPLELPPLRERMEDIEELAHAIIARLQEERGHLVGRMVRLGADALHALRAHDFPGNVRELANVIERAMVLSRDGEIGAAMLALDRLQAPPLAALTPPPAPLTPSTPAVEEALRQLILDTLVACRGNRTHAAQRLGISVRTLRNKIRAMRARGLSVPEPLSYVLPSLGPAAVARPRFQTVTTLEQGGEVS